MKHDDLEAALKRIGELEQACLEMGIQGQENSRAIRTAYAALIPRHIEFSVYFGLPAMTPENFTAAFHALGILSEWSTASDSEGALHQLRQLLDTTPPP